MYCFNVYILLIIVTSLDIVTTDATTPISTASTSTSSEPATTPTTVTSTVSSSGSSGTTTTTTTPVSGSVASTGVHSTTTVKAEFKCHNFSCLNDSCIEETTRIASQTCNTTDFCFISRINGITTGGCANNCTKSEEQSCCRADRCNNKYTPTTTTSPNYNNSNSYRIRLNGYFIHVCVVLAFTKIFILT